MTKKQDRRKNGIIDGAISLTLSTMVVKVLGLIYKIPLSHLLSDEGMGYFNSAYTVFALFYLLCTSGVPKAVMIIITEYKERGNYIDTKRIVNLAMKAFFILGAVFSYILFVFAFPIAEIIGNRNSAYTMMLIAPSIVFLSLGGVIRGALSVEMRMTEVSIAGIIEGVSRLVLGLVFAAIATRLLLPIKIVSALTILGVTLGSFFSFLYLLLVNKSHKRDKKQGRMLEYQERRAILKKIFSISIPITLSAAVMSITNIIDLILVMRGLERSGFSESVASAMYGNYTTLSVPMFNLASALITPISIVFIPSFAKHIFNNDTALQKSSLLDSTRLVSFVAAPISFGLLFFSEEILILLYGEESASVGACSLRLLVPAIVFSSLLLIVNSFLEAGRDAKWPVISMLCGAIVKMFLGCFLIPNPNYGINGAPIGTVACYAVAFIVSSLILLIRRGHTLPIIKGCLVPYTSALLAVNISKFLYVRSQGSLNFVLSILLHILIAGMIYLILLVFSGLLGKDKENLMASFTKFREKNCQ